ncbi:MAG TPA: S41 family peptidase [Gemmatimonadaceae bacterium]|nr:S41 family peptidase [Gemmatimonadaceae bacterium]
MRPSILFAGSAALAATLVAISPIAAQQAPSGPTPARTPAASPAAPARLDATIRRQVVDTMAERLRRHYAEADTGRMIAEHVQARLQAGAYDTVTNPLRFAELLTSDLQAVNGDGHLYVLYQPDNPGLRVGPEGIRMQGPPPGARPAPSRPPAGPPPGAVEQARRAHWGLGRVDVLSGNVGYLDVRGFFNGPEVETAMVNALRYLEGTDAVIIDLRRNGGGSAQSVNFLLSHFTTSDTVASLTVTNRSGNERFTRYTLAQVPGPRRPDVPLYVLTSGFTASAGEDFAFVLKNMGRATLVGATTAGAGRNNATMAVGHGFLTSVSFSRVQDPRTGKEWEKVGVQPDLVVDPVSALDRAHVMALEKIAAKTEDAAHKRVMGLLRETIEAQAMPRAVSIAELQAYVGSYEGGRTVSLDAATGRLLYSARKGAMGEPLVALGEGTFAMGPTRLVFEREGARVVRVKIVLPGGEALTYRLAQ